MTKGGGEGGMGKTKGPRYELLPQEPSAITTTPPAQTCIQKAKALRCPKLTRYKLAALVFVVLVTLVLLAVTCMRQRQPFLTGCLQSTQSSQSSQLGGAEDVQRGGIGMGNLRYSHTKRHLPHCLIIGARKAGTRALLYFLNLHSQIQTAGREIHFFDRNYEAGFDWYRKQMPFSFKDQITMEKTPAYFVEADVPARVYEMNSTIKLILILRDPIDRTMSDYLQIMDNKVKRNKPLIPFEQLVWDQETFDINRSYTAVKRSIYVRHLQRWLQYFPLSQIHIVDGDNMIAKPWEEIRKVESFLGLEHQVTHDRFTLNKTRGFYCFHMGESDHCLADGKGRPHPAIDSMVLKKLIEFFTPFNEKLFVRIGRRFNWRHWT